MYDTKYDTNSSRRATVRKRQKAQAFLPELLAFLERK